MGLYFNFLIEAHPDYKHYGPNQQNVLFNTVKALFPNLEVYENVRKECGIEYPNYVGPEIISSWRIQRAVKTRLAMSWVRFGPEQTPK